VTIAGSYLFKWWDHDLAHQVQSAIALGRLSAISNSCMLLLVVQALINGCDPEMESDECGLVMAWIFFFALLLTLHIMLSVHISATADSVLRLLNAVSSGTVSLV
jgi:hypothetical protein